MLRISWTNKVINEEVFHKTNVDRKLLNDIVSRPMKFFVYVARIEELENLIVTGFVEGKRAQGRQRETYLTYLQRRIDLTPMEPIHFAYESDVWFELSK